jgi:hypothetical protein
MTLLTDAEWRQAVDAFCEHVRALPLDDAWLAKHPRARGEGLRGNRWGVGGFVHARNVRGRSDRSLRRGVCDGGGRIAVRPRFAALDALNPKGPPTP